ncbi:MAG: DUF4430 domain-containing protein [Ruminococcus sp.]|nr:DUF4430 domain-containing protein [Ruminococcus sp.]
MKSTKTALLCIIAIALNILWLPFDIGAAAADTADSIADGICNYKTGGDSLQGFIDSTLADGAGETAEWYIMSLAQSGSYDFSKYESALLSYISSNNIASATTREKYALSLIAIGSNDSYIITALETSVGQQGLMSYVFGLHILNNGYSGGSYSTKELIDKILSLQKSDGGFAVMGDKGDVDCTAMTVQALAPYYGSNSKVKSACDKALDFMSGIQQDNGCYSSFGNENCESTAQVMLALCSLGVDPKKDERFIKNGNDLFDAVCSFRLKNGAFEHIRGKGASESANTQALYTMVGYDRLLNGKSGFYIFDNASPSAVRQPQSETEPAKTTKQTTRQTTAKETARQSAKTTVKTAAGTTSKAAAGTTKKAVATGGRADSGTSKATSGSKAASGRVTGQKTGDSLRPTDTQRVQTEIIISNGTSRAVTVTESVSVKNGTTAKTTTQKGDSKISGVPQGEMASEEPSESQSVIGDVSKSITENNDSNSPEEEKQTSAGKENKSENTDSKKNDTNIKIYIFIGIGVLTAAAVAVLIIKSKRNIKSYIFVLVIGAAACAVTAMLDIHTPGDYYSSKPDDDSSTVGTVTVSIDVFTIMGSSDSLPGDGYIISPTEVEIHDGDTAYDVLKRITREGGILLDMKGSDDMIYVSGIDGIYEFDHGELSGWMYYVNGVAPSVNSSQLTLHDGDVIEWKYTTEIGHDIDYQDEYSLAG